MEDSSEDNSLDDASSDTEAAVVLSVVLCVVVALSVPQAVSTASIVQISMIDSCFLKVVFMNSMFLSLFLK